MFGMWDFISASAALTAGVSWIVAEPACSDAVVAPVVVLGVVGIAASVRHVRSLEGEGIQALRQVIRLSCCS